MRLLHSILIVALLFSTVAYANDSKDFESTAILKQKAHFEEKNSKLLFEEKLVEHTFSHSSGVIYSESYWDKIVKRVVKASIQSIHERRDLKDRPLFIQTYNTQPEQGVFFESFEKKLKTELVSRGYYITPDKKENAVILSYGIDITPATTIMKKWNVLFTANIVAQNHYVMHMTDAFIVTQNSIPLYVNNVDSMRSLRNIATRRISIIER